MRLLCTVEHIQNSDRMAADLCPNTQAIARSMDFWQMSFCWTPSRPGNRYAEFDVLWSMSAEDDWKIHCRLGTQWSWRSSCTLLFRCHTCWHSKVTVTRQVSLTALLQATSTLPRVKRANVRRDWCFGQDPWAHSRCTKLRSIHSSASTYYSLS